MPGCRKKCSERVVGAWGSSQPLQHRALLARGQDCPWDSVKGRRRWAGYATRRWALRLEVMQSGRRCGPERLELWGAERTPRTCFTATSPRHLERKISFSDLGGKQMTSLAAVKQF